MREVPRVCLFESKYCTRHVCIYGTYKFRSLCVDKKNRLSYICIELLDCILKTKDNPVTL